MRAPRGMVNQGGVCMNRNGAERVRDFRMRGGIHRSASLSLALHRVDFPA
jgi:hypothetical protein